MKLVRAITLGVAALALGAASLSSAADKVSLRLNWYLGGLHVYGDADSNSRPGLFMISFGANTNLQILLCS